MKEKIWQTLASTDYDNFFITAEFAGEDTTYPSTLDSFIRQKLEAINIKGISGRRFLFKEGMWKIYLTFFPRNEVVSERYALKNKAFKQSSKPFD